MSSPKTVKLVLEGNVPPKKNSRARTRTGISIPNKRFVQWQKDALWQVRSQTRERFLNPVKVDVVIYFGTKARADGDNRLTSIQDMLVEGLVIKDDSYHFDPSGRFIGVYRKGEPGAFVRIREISPQEIARDVEEIING